MAAEVVQMYGKPVSVGDILAEAEPGASVKYARIPGFKEGQVFVIRSITAGDFIDWSEASDGPAKRTAGLRLIIQSVVDGEPGKDDGAKGVPIMDDTHIQVLRKLRHEVTESVLREIIKHNGMKVPQAGVKND